MLEISKSLHFTVEYILIYGITSYEYVQIYSPIDSIPQYFITPSFLALKSIGCFAY